MGQFTKRMTGSINVTALMNAVNALHSAVRVGTNGATYANVTIWLDLDQPDQNGNNISITLNSLQAMQQQDEARNGGKKVYVLNGKWPQPKTQTQQGQQWQQQAPANNWNGQQPQPQQGYQQQNGYQQQAPQNGQQWQQPTPQTQQPKPQPQPGYGQSGQNYQQPQQTGGYQQQAQPQPQQGGGYQQPQQDLPF